MQKRVAILVLSCASPPYDQMLRVIRDTWGSRQITGIDIFYLYGNVESGGPTEELSRYIDQDPPRVEPGGICQIGDVLIAGCADALSEQEDCLLRKRLIAFDYLAGKAEHDLIYTVCATSYVDPVQLIRSSATLPQTRAISGVVSMDPAHTAPFVSGASMILTADVARDLGSHRTEIISGNEYGFRDDLTIGRWVASQLSSVDLADFIDDVRQGRFLTRKHIFISTPDTGVDYVMAPQEEQRPVRGAFHYHFHRLKPDDMVRFHRRYFNLWDGSVSPGSQAIRYVQIFGERGSGTNYLANLVSENFTGVEVTQAFGAKHWYIRDHEPRGRPNRSTDFECVRPLSDSDDTLFVVIHRNPWDWLRSLQAKPFHAPGHWNLSFSEFIRKPWICSEKTRLNPLWPESDSGEYFIEEAANVLRLRSLKAMHFGNLRSIVGNSVFIRYEELAADPGMLKEVAARFDLTLKHSEPVDDTFYFGGTDGQTFERPTRYPPIAEEDLVFVQETLNWQVENRMGYARTDPPRS
jgi:hypothetical protein